MEKMKKVEKSRSNLISELARLVASFEESGVSKSDVESIFEVLVEIQYG